jgi:sialate O-acetylesterase
MRSPLSKFRVLFFCILCVSISSLGQITLPKFIGDGMVLQRDADVKIWGWAPKNEPITVQFLDAAYRTATDSLGTWTIHLAPLSAGGPYTMTINASDTVHIRDIMIGDVWVCSGQSNMELPVRRVRPRYEMEIAHSDNPSIRCFTVPQKYNFNLPRIDVESGCWLAANPNTILSFSAAAYFFAKELFDTYKIPIGLIHSSLGGSPAEAWMSEEALKKFPAYYTEAQKFKDSALIKQIETSDRVRIQEWYDQLWQKDEGYNNLRKPFYDPSINTSTWTTIKIPGYLSSTKLGAVNGVVWFRREFRLPASSAGHRARLNLGRIVDADSVYINGVVVGTTSYQYPPRWYEIPAQVLKAGKNTIVVRVISNSGDGGFVPDKPYELTVDGQTIDLQGTWRYHLGATMEPLASQTFVRWKPLGLYNAMINPLLNYRIKGVIWYQGESNTGRSAEYKELFPALIQDWRSHWNQGDFPFLFVQLANFMEPKSEPSESDWALLREAQLKTLSVPNTGMAVTIDIGEWNDIHPLNKKEVGKRLALAAQKVAYGNAGIVSSGPLYRSMKIDGRNVILTFDNIGSGLIAKGSKKLKSFAIAGADKHFVWARAKIEKDKVIVWSDKVPEPVSVRYAWAHNPQGANLYNKEELPASPFRTDEFK